MAEQKTDEHSTEQDADRPMPGPGSDTSDSSDATGSSASDSGEATPHPDADPDFKYGEDETQDFVDRSKIDFDPEDGLYTGTAIEGDTDIPGPHQDEETTGDEEAMAQKAAEMAKEEGTEDQIGEGASGSAVGAGQDGSKDDISGG